MTRRMWAGSDGGSPAWFPRVAVDGFYRAVDTEDDADRLGGQHVRTTKHKKQPSIVADQRTKILMGVRMAEWQRFALVIGVGLGKENIK
ncbi:hypothetical protein QR680_012564 [Steinernema hermaphroditum]|uniref:Uncharacterized protein n=1 Tax=Steinernema hermaphroditum TaxID=289476 RepID=A0AA39I4Z0_9BILA|nr:hypothetical protein QR680_012564 [Steinernema hermaphroditum]